MSVGKLEPLFTHVILLVDPIIHTRHGNDTYGFLRKYTWPALLRAKEYFPNLIVMDSHLALFQAYTKIELKYSNVERKLFCEIYMARSCALRIFETFLRARNEETKAYKAIFWPVHMFFSSHY